jgi:protein-histidine pros-kinase
MILLFTAFILSFGVWNMMLSWMILRPVQQMSKAANQVSTGNFDVQEFSASGKDEVAVLAASFNRMRRSLHEAMKLLEAAKK